MFFPTLCGSFGHLLLADDYFCNYLSSFELGNWIHKLQLSQTSKWMILMVTGGLNLWSQWNCSALDSSTYPCSEGSLCVTSCQ